MAIEDLAKSIGSRAATIHARQVSAKENDARLAKAAESVVGVITSLKAIHLGDHFQSQFRVAAELSFPYADFDADKVTVCIGIAKNDHGQLGLALYDGNPAFPPTVLTSRKEIDRFVTSNGSAAVDALTSLLGKVDDALK